MKDRVARGFIGVGMCKRWESVDNFVDDLGVKPNKRGWQLSRIDHLDGFSKDNCLWESRSVFRKRTSRLQGEQVEQSADLKKLIQDSCDSINSCFEAQEDVLLSKLDDIEKRAESGEEDGLNQIDACRLLKEAAQATRKALKAVASYGR